MAKSSAFVVAPVSGLNAHAALKVRLRPRAHAVSVGGFFRAGSATDFRAQPVPRFGVRAMIYLRRIRGFHDEW